MWKCGSGLFSFRKRWQPRHLDYIDKSHCNLSSVPDEIFRHTSTLEELSLEANQLRDLPKGIFRLGKLRKLVLTDNDIQDLTNDIGNLTNLEELDISKNDFQRIPDSIEKCKHLTYLDISSNTLGEVPSSITKLPSLQTWITNDIALVDIPAEIGSLANLTVLELRDNCIKFLPLSFSFLSNLQRLDLGGNELEELPDTIGQLSSLIELWLDNNFLSTLPSEIGELDALQCIDVSENRIESLPKEISGLKALTDLHVSSNMLHELPEGIGALKKLQILKLDQNEIDEVTCSIGGCISLLELVLTDNVIEFLPDAIGQLSNLSLLNIDRNRLYSLPPEIGECKQLSVLSARDNQIGKIPKEIGDCKSLIVLALSGNKLESLPFSVSTLHLKALWLAQNQSQSVLKLQVEEDQSGEEQVLTCFLFPQERLKPCSIENFMNEVYERDVTDTKFNNPSTVQFEDDDLTEKETNLTRHDTPYPKAMQGRHPHIMQKRVKPGDPDLIDGAPIAASEDSDGSKPSITINVEKPFESIINQEEEDSEKSSDDETSSEEDEKRIRFDVTESSESNKLDICKLQRTNTPHPLRNAIVQPVSEQEFQDVLSKIHRDSSTSQVSPLLENKSVEQPQVSTHLYKRRDTPTPAEFVKKAFVPRNSTEHIFSEENENDNDEEFEETITKVYEELSTTLTRDEQGLGINIAGGMGNSFQEDEELVMNGCNVDEDQGVYITKITPFGPADNDGVLKLGDKIIKVDDMEISSYSQQAVVSLLKDVGDEVTLVVLREVTDEEQINLALRNQREKNVTFAAEPEVEDIEIEALTIPVMLKRDNRGLGFSIAGGKVSNSMHKKTNEGVYISKLTEDGPAALDNRLKVGDKLLSINNVDVRSAKHDDVVKILTSCTDTVSLIAYRERVINKQMRPMSEINGGDPIKTAAESTKAEFITDGGRGEEPKLLVEEIILKKSSGPIGMSIVGGCDVASHPFGVSEPGVFVSKILPTGEAAKTNMCVGDRLLRVNDKDMRHADHKEAVSALISNEPEIKLLVRHDPPPPGIKEIVITKKMGEKLGISIRGGAKGHPGNPFDKNDEGIFISKVNPSGAAARDGRLKVGLRILEVNNTSLLGATHVDAVRALRTCGDVLSTIVCDGYDEAAASELNEENVLYNPSLCEPLRFSPDSQSSATSGDSFFSDGLNGRIAYLEEHEDDQSEGKHSASEKRALEAEKRAKWRQERLAALDTDAKKAQIVIAKTKELSTSSLDANESMTAYGSVV